MGKRRKTGDRKQQWQSNSKKNEDDTRRTLLDPESRSFVYDEVDDFEDDQDNLALSKARKLMSKKKEPKEQVLGIDSDSSDNDDGGGDDDEEESDEDNLYMEDDIVDEPEFKLPDERAWGSHRRRYFGTDTTDEKIKKKLHTEDEELAKLEEETARKLQERMAAELQDLVPDDLIPQEEVSGVPEDEASKSMVEVDLSRLSRAKKLQLLRRESPELIPLLDDLKEKCEELNSFLVPLVEGVETGKISSLSVCQYITTRYRLLLNYVCVLSVYMVTKCSQEPMGNHPVLSRLAQYRQLLQELGPCDDQLRNQLKELIPSIIADRTAKLNASPAKVKGKPRKQKTLQLLSNKSKMKLEKKRKLSDLLNDSQLSDKDDVVPQLKKKEQTQVAEASSDEEQGVNESPAVEEKDTLDPDGRRAITYQIAKNKGLLPSRKKEQRNPRVKYRNKYKNKLKKRTGQVREVRKEIQRYGGEVASIRSHTIKSIKIK
ncbi:something about silencing protein 10-like [Homarus americanus]|uniref:Something about silencing protein 10-like n=1 Tax=Homarus americanus TaxID=6706 RepID=A0A8J5K2C5_HOMAM|nr:something about silencing protein 10-like [Homarus americanus]KAG7166229.1 Something about silencing protein 10-like [Homarus americanus]